MAGVGQRPLLSQQTAVSGGKLLRRNPHQQWELRLSEWVSHGQKRRGLPLRF